MALKWVCLQLCTCKEQAKIETALKNEVLNKKASIPASNEIRGEILCSLLFYLGQVNYLQPELTCKDLY